jgi:hypothetical protein
MIHVSFDNIWSASLAEAPTLHSDQMGRVRHRSIAPVETRITVRAALYHHNRTLDVIQHLPAMTLRSESNINRALERELIVQVPVTGARSPFFLFSVT